MTIIIKTDTVISTNTKFTEPVQVASGVTLTIMAGAAVDLSGNTLLLAGNLKFIGDETRFAGLSNGKISTESTVGKIEGVFGKLQNVEIDDFFSDGTINLRSTVFDKSSVDMLKTSNLSSVLFLNSKIHASGTNNANISKSTFVDSPINATAWQGPFSGSLNLTEVNFVSAGEVITLDPFFTGTSFLHPVNVSNAYIANVEPSKIDAKIFDSDDDIRVNTDVKPSSFTSKPYTNSAKGFAVGSELVTLAQLGQPSQTISALPSILFSQELVSDGKIALKLISSTLPTGAFAFSMDLNYTGTSVNFAKVSYSGTASTSANASYVGDKGIVALSGTLFPISSDPVFATILFDATGAGVFDANITNLKVNGAAAIFTDPAAFTFAIKGDISETTSGNAAAGIYQPFTTTFGLTYAIKSGPQHGDIVFGQSGNPAEWKYTPGAGFYGADTFVLKVSDFFDTKEKTVSIFVSPMGTSGNDSFKSSSANYKVDGGAGLDTLRYTGPFANFSVVKSGNSATVTDKAGKEGTNQLMNFERLIFSDSAFALDIDGNGGQAYRLYQAAFNRVPDAKGLGFWLSVLDNGLSLESVAEGFMNSNEFKNVYGNAPTSTQLVSQFYQNVLHREPEKAGLDFWVNVLDGDRASSAQVLAAISESAENQAGVIAIIGNGFTYIPFG